ncbi:MAG: AMP-binding protein [bacterium]|nr:AMP-binding protein [bacterium]
MHTTLDRILFRAADLNRATVNFWQTPAHTQAWSYERCVHDALLVTGALQERGLRRGDRVGLVLPTHADFYRAFFGVILAGGIPAALYPPVRLGKIDAWKDRTAAMLRAIDCSAVLTDARLYGLLGQPVRQTAPPLGCFTVQALMREAAHGTHTEVHSDDLAVVQFSSGTTRNPRPIALTHANILSNAQAILASLPGDALQHSGVSWLPLYHDMGLVGNLVSAMLVPAPLTLIRPEQFVARPRVWLEAMTQSQATVSGAPNFAFGLCAERLQETDLAGLDLSRWQVAFCGAETVHPQTLQAFARRFAPVGFNARALAPVYGLAEATLAVTLSSFDAPPRFTSFNRHALERKGRAMAAHSGIQLAALGQPLAGVEVEIREVHGEALPPGHLGRLWVRGPGVMQGYLDQPQATRQVLQAGWCDTGDQGFFHDGQLYLFGRVSDIIIIRGHNHDPAQIERSLHGIAGLRAGCAVAFGIADVDRGTERLVVLAEYRVTPSLADQSRLEAEGRAAIQASCNLQVSDWILLPPGTLPRTSSGKLRRRETRRLWQTGTLRAPASSGIGTLIRQTLSGLWAQRQARHQR